MATNSAIEWTEATWNPIAGCTPVSSGCLHCYAATMAHRLDKMGQAKYAGLTVLRNGVRTFNGKINLDEEALSIPLKRKKPTMYFVNSMSDLFHKDVPFEFIDKVFAVMALCPQHTFQVLTKRPARMAEYFSDGMVLDWDKTIDSLPNADDITIENNHPILETLRDCTDEYYTTTKRGMWPLPNVWLGTSVENQQAADERIPHLLKCPAAVRFLSCEPLLSAVNLNSWLLSEHGRQHIGAKPGIHWCIVGGESGGGARENHIPWTREIVRQCKSGGVAVFVKQLGGNAWSANRADHVHPERQFGTLDVAAEPLRIWMNDKKGGDIAEFPADLRIREFPKP